MRVKKQQMPMVLIDSLGREIPTEHIDKQVIKRHLLVNESFEKMFDYMLLTKNFKQWVFDMVKSYLDEIAGEYGEKWQGNASIMDFSQTKKLSLDIQKFISFDEKLNIAKSKIDNCMKRWADGARNELRTLVMEAFSVDKKGNLDTKLILGLRKYKFEDSEWVEAMDIIAEAVLVVGKKSYIRFASRDTSEGNWIGHTLNFSSVNIEKGGKNGNG